MFLLVLRLKRYARQSPAKRPIGTPGSPVESRGVVLDADESKYIYKHQQYVFWMISMNFTSGQIDEGGVESERARAGGRTIMGRF